MKADIKERWVAALRSGEYKQGHTRLRETGDRFCCLGVLTDLAVKDGVCQWKARGTVWSVDGVHGSLPPLVAEWAGARLSPAVYHNNEKRELWALNDLDDLDFEEIADLIEASDL